MPEIKHIWAPEVFLHQKKPTKMVMIDFVLQSTAFLEPYSQVIRQPVNYTIPGLMYGTQLAEEGVPSCNIKGYDFEQFYEQWKCPRIAIEVAVS